MPNIARLAVDRHRPTILRRDILQKFDRRPGWRPKAGYPQPRTKDVVQMLLLRPMIFAFSDHLHSQGVAIKFKTPIGVGDHNRRMIDTQKQFVGFSMPFGIAFSGWKVEYLKIVLIGIPEVKRPNTGCSLIPIGNPLGTGGGMLNLVIPQPSVSTVHITHDNGDMLKPAVVTARIPGYGATFGGQIFGQLDNFAPQLDTHDAHA